MNKGKKKNSSNKKQKQKVKSYDKWYQNNLFVLLMLITVFPLGLFLVLTNDRLKKELLPTAKVIGVIALVIIVFKVTSSDKIKPELEMKSEMTYSLKDDFSPKQLINDYYISVSDNESDLKKEDISIKNYKKLDFSQKGTQTINFIVSDDDMNFNCVESKIIIK